VNKQMFEIAGNHELRGYILKIANEIQPFGAGVPFIKILLHQLKFTPDEATIMNACKYLEGKGLVRMENVCDRVKNISRDIVYITPKGIDVLEGTETVSGVELVGD